MFIGTPDWRVLEGQQQGVWHFKKMKFALELSKATINRVHADISVRCEQYTQLLGNNINLFNNTGTTAEQLNYPLLSLLEP